MLFYRGDTKFASLPQLVRLRVHVAVSTVGDASHVSPHVADGGCVLLKIDVPTDAVLLVGETALVRLRARRDLAGHAVAFAVESGISSRLPYCLLVDNHLRGVVDPAVGRLVHEMQRRLLLVSVADTVAGVDDVVCSAQQRQVAVISKGGLVGIVVSVVYLLQLVRQFHGAQDVVPGVGVCSLDTANGLDDISRGATAESDG